MLTADDRTNVYTALSRHPVNHTLFSKANNSWSRRITGDTVKTTHMGWYIMYKCESCERQSVMCVCQLWRITFIYTYLRCGSLTRNWARPGTAYGDAAVTWNYNDKCNLLVASHLWLCNLALKSTYKRISVAKTWKTIADVHRWRKTLVV